jgi:hypothetical protein
MTLIEVTRLAKRGEFFYNPSMSFKDKLRITDLGKYQRVTEGQYFSFVILDSSDVLRDDWEVFIAK